MRKRIEVVATKVTKQESNITSNVLFEDLLATINDTQAVIDGNRYSIHILNNINDDNYLVGYVKSLKNKDLPPKENISTQEQSSLDINPKEESLAYANIFLYDKSHNVLLYEINGNGCYLNKLIQVLTQTWSQVNRENSEATNSSIDVIFPVVLRQNAYNRILNMTSFSYIKTEISNPSALINDIESQAQSIRNNVIAMNILQASDDNVKTIKIEQKAVAHRISPDGLPRFFVKKCVDFVRAIAMKNITVMEVKGYALDPESDKQKPMTVDLLGATFKNLYINLPNVIIHQNLQILERKEEIIRIYSTILRELRNIFQNQ